MRISLGLILFLFLSPSLSTALECRDQFSADFQQVYEQDLLGLPSEVRYWFEPRYHARKLNLILPVLSQPPRIYERKALKIPLNSDGVETVILYNDRFYSEGFFRANRHGNKMAEIISSQYSFQFQSAQKFGQTVWSRGVSVGLELLGPPLKEWMPPVVLYRGIWKETIPSWQRILSADPEMRPDLIRSNIPYHGGEQGVFFTTSLADARKFSDGKLLQVTVPYLKLRSAIQAGQVYVGFEDGYLEFAPFDADVIADLLSDSKFINRDTDAPPPWP